MLTLPIQKGPGNQLYVALDTSDECSTIYQVTYTGEKKIDYKQAYKSVSQSVVSF